MVPKYFFIAVFIVIGSTLVASQKCPKDNTNSSNSCSRRVSGGEFVCNGQPCVYCTNCKCLSYCWKNEGDWRRNYNCVCTS
ncbi:9770_t:CDS:2 [Funneliformis caledonium]|uniref:9770_t:CDS:1 n=1 Tax=Funneliformis caledonium TaxID=1117310 RepID=A0A9N9DN08_9GLOM|nr:9770_t:CDS:2 [Funneliformis caledonium]